uniref:Bardet-Biedl syndrome 12 n=1 Tax=Nothobranchius furzeri TaxID=105023 RepID=A0A1A8V2B9_NOTFU
MLESGIINRRHHVGLQKVSALAEMGHSFVGPYKKYKFIQDDTNGGSALVCSCFRVIESLEPTCAVGQIVLDTIQAHHEVYRTGSGCLLFLAGAWSRAALDCLERGISVTHIISAMSEGMDICIDVCKKSSVPFEALADTGRCTATSRGSGSQLVKKPTPETSQVSGHMRGTATVGHQTLNISVQRKVKLSRHFYGTEVVSPVVLPDQPKFPDISHISTALSHGCDNSMKLAVEVVQMQWKTDQQEMNYPTFDTTKVMTCVLPCLPEDCACVVPGCVVLLSSEQASIAHQIKEKPLKVAFINGDLSHTYRHLGFKSLTGLQRVSQLSDLSHSSGEVEWLEKVVKLLLTLEVHLILTAGFAHEKLIQSCLQHKILIVEKVKLSVIRMIAKSVGAVPVTYATQLSKHCVGTGVQVAIWRDLSSFERTASTVVNISTGMNTGLVTVVISSCLPGKLQGLEDQFWACAHRLHHSMKDQAILPGAGGTEILCFHHLQRQAEYHSRRHTEAFRHNAGAVVNPYKSVVLGLMAGGLLDYIITVMANSGTISAVTAKAVVSHQLQKFHKDQNISGKFPQLILEGENEASATLSVMSSEEVPSIQIYDNVSVKQDAWRRALDLVFLVLQTDAEIITGGGSNDGADLMLL